MSYRVIGYGSYGSDVSKLQKHLNNHGYKLDVDGGFGKKTQKALLDYQKKNGLAVDGVAGNETWGRLVKDAKRITKGKSTGKQVMGGVSDETANRLSQLEQGYRPSDEVAAAEAEHQSMGALRPGDYHSSYDKQLEALYDEIAGRKEFAYDPQQDAAYQRYAEMYQRQGRTAMEDTLGQAASLSGGYDSSYAQTAAQQSYQQYLQELAQVIPQLEKNARDAYQQEGQALQGQYDLLQDKEEDDYRRWQDEQKAWQQSMEQAEDRYEFLRRQDYDAYQDMLHHFSNKANAEQKASNGRNVNSGKPGKKPKKPVLSSVAGDSLQRAMGNYLKGGDKRNALTLVSKYAYRMTPGQKKRAARLFKKYGVAVDL